MSPRSLVLSLSRLLVLAIVSNGASKSEADKYVASVGKETFEVQINLDLTTGKIVSGILDNPLEVLERDCADGTVKKCGAPMRYQIHRHVEIR